MPRRFRLDAREIEVIDNLDNGMALMTATSRSRATTGIFTSCVSTKFARFGSLSCSKARNPRQLQRTSTQAKSQGVESGCSFRLAITGLER